MKKKLISLGSALAVASSLAPITMVSCGSKHFVPVGISEEGGQHNVSITSPKAEINKEFNATINWDDKSDWILSTCIVKVGDDEIDPKTYTFNKASGEIKINAEVVKGNIDILVKLRSSELSIPTKWLAGGSLDFTLAEPEKHPHYGQDYTNVIAEVQTVESLVFSGFDIYVSRTAAVPLYRGDDYTIDFNTGEFTIFGNNVTDDIFIDIHAKRVELSMKQSDEVQYVKIENNRKIATFDVGCSLVDPDTNGDIFSKDDDYSIDVSLNDPDDKIEIVSKEYDDVKHIISIKIASKKAELDLDLFDVNFEMTVKIVALDTNTEIATKTFADLWFVNAITNTPDMLKYNDSKTIVTGANDDDARWDKCEALLIPKTVEKIADSAFKNYGSSKKTNVKWLYLDETWNGKLDPKGCKLREIGSSAFSNSWCIGEGLYIPASVEQIDSMAFAVTGNKGYEVHFVHDNEGKTKIKKIGESAFNDANTKGALVIPKSIETLERNIFHKTNFTSISFEQGINLKEIGTASDEANTGATFANMKQLEGSIEIPTGVKTIYKKSFYVKEGTNKINTIVIPSSVEKIDLNAFSNLNNLATIDMSTWEFVPTWTGSDIFTNAASTGQVKVKDSIVGEEILKFLKTKGLPGGWTCSIG